MERRKHRRFFISLHATITVDGKNFEGVIGNVSEEGVASMITTVIKTDRTFSPHKHVTLAIELPDGEAIQLNCEIRWFLRSPSKDQSLMLGLHVPEPPQSYNDWLKKFNLR